MCEIKLTNITFAYGEDVVLKDLSLTVASGDFVAIVGPNGAGKSTLLKLMAGLLTPQQGKISVAGRAVEKARKQGMIGYVPQNYGKNTLGFPATVEEVVELGLVSGSLIKRANKNANRHIVQHMLELVDATDLRHRRIGELSGGQQQRVMVAKALAGNPRILLLDEPTSGVDYAASTRIYELLGQLNKNLNITIAIVSHDIEKAVQQAGKVACINRGLCYFGSSGQFQSNHATTRHYWYYTG